MIFVLVTVAGLWSERISEVGRQGRRTILSMEESIVLLCTLHDCKWIPRRRAHLPKFHRCKKNTLYQHMGVATTTYLLYFLTPSGIQWGTRWQRPRLRKATPLLGRRMSCRPILRNFRCRSFPVPFQCCSTPWFAIRTWQPFVRML